MDMEPATYTVEDVCRDFYALKAIVDQTDVRLIPEAIFANGICQSLHAGLETKVRTLPDGQGDAAAIHTPAGHWLIVDAGPAGEAVGSVGAIDGVHLEEIVPLAAPDRVVAGAAEQRVVSTTAVPSIDGAASALARHP